MKAVDYAFLVLLPCLYFYGFEKDLYFDFYSDIFVGNKIEIEVHNHLCFVKNYYNY